MRPDCRRGPLHPCDARAAQPRIVFERGRDAGGGFSNTLVETFCQHRRVLDRHSRALRRKRKHGVRGISQQCDGTIGHSPPSGIVNSAHFRQSSTAPIIIRAVPGHLDEANAFLISQVSPGALQPGLFQVPGTTATTLICRAPDIG